MPLCGAHVHVHVRAAMHLAVPISSILHVEFRVHLPEPVSHCIGAGHAGLFRAGPVGRSAFRSHCLRPARSVPPFFLPHLPTAARTDRTAPGKFGGPGSECGAGAAGGNQTVVLSDRHEFGTVQLQETEDLLRCKAVGRGQARHHPAHVGSRYGIRRGEEDCVDERGGIVGAQPELGTEFGGGGMGFGQEFILDGLLPFRIVPLLCQGRARHQQSEDKERSKGQTQTAAGSGFQLGNHDLHPVAIGLDGRVRSDPEYAPEAAVVSNS